jgi:hypothetical protein
VEARRRARMLGAQRLFVDRQRTLLERPRPRKVALEVEQVGEVFEAWQRIGMLGAERLFADCQCALYERPRARKVASEISMWPMLLRLVAVWGCSGPSTFSRIASA